MTIKEFYNWAIDNSCENYEVEIQYRDDGGYYVGTDSLEENYIEIVEEDEIVII